jgi:hypothetical protein
MAISAAIQAKIPQNLGICDMLTPLELNLSQIFASPFEGNLHQLQREYQREYFRIIDNKCKIELRLSIMSTLSIMKRHKSQIYGWKLG